MNQDNLHVTNPDSNLVDDKLKLGHVNKKEFKELRKLYKQQPEEFAKLDLEVRERFLQAFFKGNFPEDLDLSLYPNLKPRAKIKDLSANEISYYQARSAGNSDAELDELLAKQQTANIKVLLDTMSGRGKLTLPEGKKNLLLHSCCAPCSGEVMEALLASGIPFTVFFYNPNIHPLKEYLIRKNENLRYCEEHNIPFIDWDYNRKDWFERTKGMEWEPERGIRCTECFDMRFEVTAKYAVEHGFDIFTSCLGISRWKNFEQITDCGNRAAAPYEGLEYWDYNWRKNGGASRMIKISKREEFYQQEYCGCVYSLRDSNAYRESVGREKIHIGIKYYSFNSETNDCE